MVDTMLQPGTVIVVIHFSSGLLGNDQFVVQAPCLALLGIEVRIERR
jgi:hypothetical protein